jgi:uncharacterized membrane protein YedE/YeeE
VPLLILAAAAALQAWAWQRLSTHVIAGTLTKAAATLRYTIWALVPLLLFLLAIAAAVGVEQWRGVALVPEPMARATALIAAFLLGAATLGSICFVVRCAFLKPRRPFGRDAA